VHPGGSERKGIETKRERKIEARRKTRQEVMIVVNETDRREGVQPNRPFVTRLKSETHKLGARLDAKSDKK